MRSLDRLGPLLASVATLVVMATAGACKPAGQTPTRELCAKAAAIYDRCEDKGLTTPLDRELEVDRWRSLCLAVFTGETKPLGPDALALYQQMDDGTKAGLRVQAECTAQATTCDAYRACEE